MSIEKNDNALQILKENDINTFPEFLDQLWQYLDLPELTPVQIDIAEYLERSTYKGSKRGVQAFRGVGKSYITAGYIVWRVLRNPKIIIKVISATSSKSKDMLRMIKGFIENLPYLSHLKPKGESAVWNNQELTVAGIKATQDPTIKAMGIDSQLTGGRADLIVSDDIEYPKNSNTQVLREDLRKKIKEFSAMLKPESDEILYLGTPQCEQSIYIDIPNVSWKIWPVVIPNDPNKYKGQLGPYVMYKIKKGATAGTTLCTRFDKETVENKKIEYGASGFALQFMLDTSLSDAEKYPLKLKNLIVTDLASTQVPVSYEWTNNKQFLQDDLIEKCLGLDGDRYFAPSWVSLEREDYQLTGLFIDPSGSGKDETAYAVVSYSHGLLFLRDIGGFLDGTSESTLSALAELCVQWGVKICRVEQNFGGGMFTQLLKPRISAAWEKEGKNCRTEIDEVRHSKQKEKRIIQTLEPLINTHKLIVDRNVIKKDYQDSSKLGNDYSLIYQFTRIHDEKGALVHDDRLDALSIGVDFYNELMVKDNAKVQRQLEEERIEDSIKWMHQGRRKVQKNMLKVF